MLCLPSLPQTWIGPMLLCVNPFEPPSPAMHVVLRKQAQTLLLELSESQQSRALIFKYVYTHTHTHIMCTYVVHTYKPGMIVGRGKTGPHPLFVCFRQL